MKIAIIGGGMMGLTVAQKLSHSGHQLTVFEANQQLGGLTTHHDYGSFVWDKFYHVILPSDTYLINFLKDIGLADKLRWKATLTGCYMDKKLYSISNTVEFFMFPPLTIIGKLRLAFTLLYGSWVKNWKKLENITVEKWLLKLSGQNAYEKLWKPLLIAKLGGNYQRVSAVFIWSYIKRLFSARDSSSHKEKLGYVAGGYKTVFDRLGQLITDAGGKILTGVPVEHIFPDPKGGMWLEYQHQKEHFDKVIFTAPVNVLEKTVAPELVQITNNGKSVEYLGVICMVLLTRKPLVPYYIVNLADKDIPFTGVLGMSNLVSLEETGGFHITYLPKYIHSEDIFWEKTDEDLHQLFFPGLRLMFPDLKPEDIVAVHINRAKKMQPLQVLHYSNLVPQVFTQHDDFQLLNTSQFVNDTLNNNTVVKHVSEFVDNFI